ncbi:MAG: hypothetical protein E6R03_06850 [Hyphomicrobiaceae bacterium]|nr:MAG: hypothetical protein E6R03_06850 [Hyphomicrobiaceae bacterium]
MPYHNGYHVWMKVEDYVDDMLDKRWGVTYLTTSTGAYAEERIKRKLFKAFEALMDCTMADGCVATYHTKEDLSVAYALLVEEADKLISRS